MAVLRYISLGSRQKPVLAGLLGGALLGLPFFIPWLWPVAFFGVALVVWGAANASSLRVAFLSGFLAGVLLNGASVYGMFFAVLPIEGLPQSEQGLQTVLAVLGWLFIAGGTSLSFGAFSVAARFLSRNSAWDIIIIPSLWVLAETGVAFLFAFLNLGGGSVPFELNAGAAMVGNFLAEDCVLLYFATFGGVFLLSGLVALVGTLLYRAVSAPSPRERQYVRLALSIALLIYAVLHVIGFPRADYTNAPVAQVAVLATTLGGPYDPAKNLAEQSSLIAKSAGADVVVLPEGAEFGLKLRDTGLSYPSGARFYADSAEVREPKGLVTRAEFYDTALATTTYAYKRFLMPVGEYMPYVLLAVAHLFGVDRSQSFSVLAEYRSHRAGPPPVPVATADGWLLGFRFCSEVYSPTLLRSLAHDGAEVLAVGSSPLWYHGSRVVFAQMLHSAQVRAVETGRWLLVADNAAPALILNAAGEVVEETPWDAEGAVIRRDIPLLSQQTPYDTMGPSVLFVPLIIVLIALIRRSAPGILRI